MNRWIRYLGITVALLATGFFVAYALRFSEDIPALDWTLETILVLVGSGLIYVAVIGIVGLTWHLLLAGSGGSLGIASSYAIVSLSQFAKYIPGNVGHHLGRIALARNRGLPMPRVVLTMGYEAGWQILASALLGAGWLIFSGDQSEIASILAPQAWLIAVFALAGLAAPIAAGWILTQWRPRIMGIDGWSGEVQLPGTNSLLAVLILNGLAFFLFGTIISLILIIVYDVKTYNLLYHTGLFSVAWVAGFVTPGAPAGLGVRDAILAAGLGAVYGPGIAVGLAILLRLVTISGDGLAFASGVLMRRILW